MIMPNEYEYDGRGQEKPDFADVIASAVHEYVGTTPAMEIIGILETAKACVIQEAIDKLNEDE